jgi:hypothetical protein
VTIGGDHWVAEWHVGHLATERDRDQYLRMLIIFKCVACHRLRRMSPRCECGKVEVEPVVLMAESNDEQRITAVETGMPESLPAFADA